MSWGPVTAVYYHFNETFCSILYYQPSQDCSNVLKFYSDHIRCSPWRNVFVWWGRRLMLMKNTEVKTSELPLVVSKLSFWFFSVNVTLIVESKSLTCSPGQRNISDIYLCSTFFFLSHIMQMHSFTVTGCFSWSQETVSRPQNAVVSPYWSPGGKCAAVWIF